MNAALAAALESGMVESLILKRNLGECLLCMEDKPEQSRGGIRAANSVGIPAADRLAVGSALSIPIDTVKMHSMQCS